MKIVSRFTDYYDSVGRHDHDDKPFYLRQPSEPLDAEGDGELHRALLRARVVLGLMPPLSVGIARVLGFCGRAWPLYDVGSEEKPHACYGLEDLARFLRGRLETARDDYEAELALSQLENERGGMWSLNPRSWRAFEHDANLDIGDDAFRALAAPAFLLYPGGGRLCVESNPRLSTWGFARHLDPYTAYQTLDVYLGNNLSGLEERGPEPSDELKRHAHGYNEWSFKKRPKKDR
jgi:hypothetical protein